MPGAVPVGWLAALFIFLLGLGFALTAVGGSKFLDWLLGSDRDGPKKGTAYETGMPIRHDSRRRFNVRFYLIAMLFILFDVEIIFLIPLLVTLGSTIRNPEGAAAAQLSEAMALPLPEAWLAIGVLAMLFMAILVVGLAYEWMRGVLKFE